MNLINKLVHKNLKLNKKRTVVSMIGIILSVALLTALFTLVASFRESLISYEINKNGDFHVCFEGVTDKELKDLKNNRSLESIYTISDIGYAYLKDSQNPDKVYAHVIATDKYGMDKAKFKLLEGRMPENENEIVIPRHLKQNARIEYKVGDTITLGVGKRVLKETGEALQGGSEYSYDMEELRDIKEETYTIVGIIERPGYYVEDYSCPGFSFVTYSSEPADDFTAYARVISKKLNQMNAVVSGILGVDKELFEKVNGGDGEVPTNEEYNEYIRQISEVDFTFDINSWLISYEKLWPIDPSFRVLFVIAVIVAAIIVITSVYCIKNSFYISITEKIRQYGMLSSVGATKKQLRKSVHKEASVMGIISVPIGLGCGLLAAFVLTKLSNYLLMANMNMTLIFRPTWIAMLISVILGVVTIYFSAVGSAMRAGRVTPLEAIRNQNEIAIKSKKIRAPKYVKKIWGIGGVISYKNIKRNRKKYRTTVVSIVICTVTFILISYFMSMAFDLVGAAYANDRYNVELSLYFHDIDQFDRADIDALDKYSECNITRANNMYVDNYSYTDKYEQYIKNLYDDDTVVEQGMLVIVMDDASFEDYERESGIVSSDGKAILVNEVYCEWMEGEEQRKGNLETFRYKAGDTVDIFRYVDDVEAVSDEPGLDKENYRVFYKAELEGISTVRPMGYKMNDMTQQLVMSESYAKEIELFLRPEYYIHFVSDDADGLQDDLEMLIKKYSGDTGYSIYNRDKNAKEEKSLFLLLEIFAYGLISVIALIGITNIINTLNTSMELRSREFATLRSIGMTDSQFNRMVRLESFFTGSKALFFGVVIGMLLSYAINRIECRYDIVIVFHPPVKAALISVVVVMGLVYIIIKSSLSKINKRNIIETIKNENL